MLDIRELPDNFCIGHYIPQRFWPEPDCSCDNFVELILAVQDREAEAIADFIQLLNQNLDEFDAVAAVPSRIPGNRSGIQDIAQGLANLNQVTCALSCLQRTKEIPAHGKGHRTLNTHLHSIELKYPELINGKVVLLLDDIRTTGDSLQACQQILEHASTKKVVPLALAQTCYPGDDNHPGRFYEELQESVQMDYADKFLTLKQKFENEQEYLELLLEQALGAINELSGFGR